MTQIYLSEILSIDPYDIRAVHIGEDESNEEGEIVVVFKDGTSISTPSDDTERAFKIALTRLDLHRHQINVNVMTDEEVLELHGKLSVLAVEENVHRIANTLEIARALANGEDYLATLRKKHSSCEDGTDTSVMMAEVR